MSLAGAVDKLGKQFGESGCAVVAVTVAATVAVAVVAVAVAVAAVAALAVYGSSNS